MLVDNRKDIAINYMKTWFIIDVVAILPFGYIFQSANFNALARIARLPRLYKLVRMFRLMRMLKLAKEKSKLTKKFNQMLKLGVGFERLLFLLISFFLLCHIITCFWVMIIVFESDDPNTWIYQKGYQDLSDSDLYVRSFYFTVTTLTTVGFGDISPTTTLEMLFGVVVMIVGVGAFSFATGSLSSIFSSLDASQAKLKEKLQVLDHIRDQYNVGPALYEELRQTIQFCVGRDVSQTMNFINKFPQRLRVELSTKIFKEIIKQIPFFSDKNKQVIAFIGPLLTPERAKEDQVIYNEGDPIHKIYFLTSGIAGFVITKARNAVYITVQEGDYFGDIDLNLLKTENENKITRKTSVIALSNCEYMTMQINSLPKLHENYPTICDELFGNSLRKFRRVMRLKKEAIIVSKPMSFVSSLRSDTGLKTTLSMKDRALTKHLVIDNVCDLKDIAEEEEIASEIDEDDESSLNGSYDSSFKDEEEDHNLQEMMNLEQRMQYDEFHKKINEIRVEDLKEDDKSGDELLDIKVNNF